MLKNLQTYPTKACTCCNIFLRVTMSVIPDHPPRVSGCTIRSDYSFDGSACWSAPDSEGTLFHGVVSTTATLKGRASCSGSNAFVQTQISQGDTITLCMSSTDSDYTGWRIGEMTTSSYGTGQTLIANMFEFMSIPNSRKSAFQAPQIACTATRALIVQTGIQHSTQSCRVASRLYYVVNRELRRISVTTSADPQK